jgi:hypothetical protein
MQSICTVLVYRLYHDQQLSELVWVCFSLRASDAHSHSDSPSMRSNQKRSRTSASRSLKICSKNFAKQMKRTLHDWRAKSRVQSCNVHRTIIAREFYSSLTLPLTAERPAIQLDDEYEPWRAAQNQSSMKDVIINEKTDWLGDFSLSLPHFLSESDRIDFSFVLDQARFAEAGCENNNFFQQGDENDTQVAFCSEFYSMMTITEAEHGGVCDISQYHCSCKVTGCGERQDQFQDVLLTHHRRCRQASSKFKSKRQLLVLPPDSYEAVENLGDWVRYVGPKLMAYKFSQLEDVETPKLLLPNSSPTANVLSRKLGFTPVTIKPETHYTANVFTLACAVPEFHPFLFNALRTQLTNELLKGVRVPPPRSEPTVLFFMPENAAADLNFEQFASSIVIDPDFNEPAVLLLNRSGFYEYSRNMLAFSVLEESVQLETIVLAHSRAKVIVTCTNFMQENHIYQTIFANTDTALVNYVFDIGFTYHNWGFASSLGLDYWHVQLALETPSYARHLKPILSKYIA